jgi:hypothetical protein
VSYGASFTVVASKPRSRWRTKSARSRCGVPNIIIQRYGDDAPLEAAKRADEMLEKGEMEGRRVWQRIMKAAVELRRVRPDEGQGVH